MSSTPESLLNNLSPVFCSICSADITLDACDCIDDTLDRIEDCYDDIDED